MDAFLPEYQYLHPGPKFAARVKQWWEAFPISEDAGVYLLEISKFLGTVALIVITGLILLMAE